MSKKVRKRWTKAELENYYANLKGEEGMLFREFVRLGAPKKLAFDLAFNFWELKPEIFGVGKLLCRICKKRKCTPRQFDQLMATVAFHWPYHVNDINRAFLKLPWIELTTPREVDSRKQKRVPSKSAR